MQNKIAVQHQCTYCGTTERLVPVFSKRDYSTIEHVCMSHTYRITANRFVHPTLSVRDPYTSQPEPIYS